MEVQSTFSPGRKIHGIEYGFLGSFWCRVSSNEEYQRTVKAWPALLPRATRMHRGRDVKPDFSVMVRFTLELFVYEM